MRAKSRWGNLLYWIRANRRSRANPAIKIYTYLDLACRYENSPFHDHSDYAALINNSVFKTETRLSLLFVVL